MEDKYEIENCMANSDNKEFMMQAIKDDATWVLAYASPKIKSNKKMMMECAKKDGQILYYASEDLRDDKEFVMECIQQKWTVIKYASYRLRSDKDVCLLAIKRSKEDEELNKLVQGISPTLYFTKEAMELEKVKEALKKEEPEG